MKKLISIIVLISLLTLMSFDSQNEMTPPPCNLTITTLNDSTYVIFNNGNLYQSEIKTLLGTPKIKTAGDTIIITGEGFFSVVIIASDSLKCLTTKTVNQ